MNTPAYQLSYERLYRLAEQQAGYFTAFQAQQAGFTARQLFYYTSVAQPN
jgi:hypothetical protein